MNSRGTAAPEPSGRQSCLVVCGRGPALFPTLGHSHVGLQNNPSCTEPLMGHSNVSPALPSQPHPPPIAVLLYSCVLGTVARKVLFSLGQETNMSSQGLSPTGVRSPVSYLSQLIQTIGRFLSFLLTYWIPVKHLKIKHWSMLRS